MALATSRPASPTPPSRRTIAGLFALALIPRLALALAFLQAPIGLDDMFQYDMLGRSLAAGRGFRWYARADVERLRPYLDRYYDIQLRTEQVPVDGFATTFRAPGYPLFLAALYALFGLERRLAVARLVQAVLGAMLAPLTAWLAYRLGLSERPARLAGASVALYPILWMYPIGLASEDLFLPLSALALLALLGAGRTRRLREALTAGLALAAGILTRGALALFLPVAALWLWRRAGWRQAGLLILTVGLGLLPWMVRNSLLLRRPSFVENSMGYNLFVGYHPDGDGGFVTQVAVIPLRFLDDAERDRWVTAQALGFIRADPVRALALLPRRLAYFWGFEDRELIYFYSNNFFGPIPQPWLGLAFALLVTPLVTLGLAAPLGLALPQGVPGRGLALGLAAATMLAYVPVLAEPRFHLPLIPILAAYAAAAWSTRGLGSRWREGMRRGHAVWRLATAAVLLLLLLWGWGLAREWPRLAAVMAPGGNQLGLSY